MGMEMRGRRATPTNLVLLRGNPGKKSMKQVLNHNEPKPKMPDECPKHPPLLSQDKYAKKMWKQYAPMLYKMGCLTEADVPLLAILCMDESRLYAAKKLQEKHGVYTREGGTFDKDGELKGGLIRRAPWMTEIDSCIRSINSLVGHFGMSPSIRSKMSVKPIKEEDEFEKLMKQGNHK